MIRKKTVLVVPNDKRETGEKSSGVKKTVTKMSQETTEYKTDIRFII